MRGGVEDLSHPHIPLAEWHPLRRTTREGAEGSQRVAALPQAFGLVQQSHLQGVIEGSPSWPQLCPQSKGIDRGPLLPDIPLAERDPYAEHGRGAEGSQRCGQRKSQLLPRD
jgi:hypothetical protein